MATLAANWAKQPKNKVVVIPGRGVVTILNWDAQELGAHGGLWEIAW